MTNLSFGGRVLFWTGIVGTLLLMVPLMFYSLVVDETPPDIFLYPFAFFFGMVMVVMVSDFFTDNGRQQESVGVRTPSSSNPANTPNETTADRTTADDTGVAGVDRIEGSMSTQGT